jgi:hypothetical protein
MKKFVLLFLTVFLSGITYTQVTSVPHLEKQGNAVKLIVRDKPF